MTTYLECYLLKRYGEEALFHASKVKPGETGFVKTFLPSGVMVACDTEDTKATVFLNNPFRVRIKMYEDNSDIDGEDILGDKPIKLTGDQMVAIRPRRRHPSREVVVYHVSDDDEGYDDDSSLVPDDGGFLLGV